MFGNDVAPTELEYFHLHHYKYFVPTGLGVRPLLDSTTVEPRRE